MKIVGSPEKTNANTIVLEVVIEELETKKMERPKAAKLPRGSPKKEERGVNTRHMVSGTVELRCLTMTGEQGTSCEESKIPVRSQCSLCGSAFNKDRM